MSKDEDRQRQSERLREAVERKAEQSRAGSEEDSLASTERPAEKASVRTKSSGHRKKTADKWNQ